ncbi:hypothetical protein CPT_Shaeky_060 [Streptomyces phage Shaeky]|uniref:Uncharacterized protein n=1 Tax=Streptomyces phage Shaeky TaxID=2767586 RepID=A0A873WE44_9CAUD|nr:hypothetical protein CPT_Shaeky_060 [Streptomyces phage Shaeky]
MAANFTTPAAEGQFVILRYGNPVDDVFVGPGPMRDMYELCMFWNDCIDERNRKRSEWAEPERAYYIKRVA